MKKNIIFIIFGLFMLLLNFFVGPSLRDSLLLVNIFSLVITIGYMIYCFIKMKEFRMFNSKIDILITLFLLLPLIPLIFKSYVSISSVMNTLLQNISILSMYFIIKNICSKANLNKIINILIYASIPIIVIGIDRMTYGYIWDFLLKYDIFSIEYQSDRLLANFNYPNTLAIYISSLIFLILGQIKNTKKEILNWVYNVYLFILFLMVLLTMSRSSIILLGVGLIIYLFLIKGSKRKIIYILLNALLGSFIYMIIIELFNLGSGSKIFMIVILSCLILLFYNLYDKFDKYLKKVSIKKLLIILGIFILSLVVYIIVGLNVSEALVINKSESYKIKNDGNNSYNIEVDMNSKYFREEGKYQNYDNFEIKIETIDEFSNKYIVSKDNFSAFNGRKKYEIKVTEKTKYIIISFNNYYKNEMSINNLYINGKKHIVNYKLLPDSVINKFRFLDFDDMSINERLVTYKDSLNIAKRHLIIGNGSNAWLNLYKSYQSYNYSVNIMHSFIFDTLISYGLIGISVLISIVAIIVIYILKNIKRKNVVSLSIVFSISILFIHCLIDFDLSFLLIKYYIVILISLLLYNYKEYKSNNLFLVLFIFVSFIFFIIFNCCNIYVRYRIDNINKIDFEDRYYVYEKLKYIYPYSLDLIYYKTFYEYNLILNGNYNIQGLEENFINDLNKLSKYEHFYQEKDTQSIYVKYIKKKIDEKKINEDEINDLHNMLKNYSIPFKYNISSMLNRWSELMELYRSYKKYLEYEDSKFVVDKMNDIKNIILDEHENFSKNLDYYQEFRMPLKTYKTLIKDYRLFIKSIKMIKNV